MYSKRVRNDHDYHHQQQQQQPVDTVNRNLYQTILLLGINKMFPDSMHTQTTRPGLLTHGLSHLLLPVRASDRPELINSQKQLLRMQTVLHPEHVGAVDGVKSQQEVAVHGSLFERLPVLPQAQGGQEAAHVDRGPEPRLRGEGVGVGLIYLFLPFEAFSDCCTSGADLSEWEYIAKRGLARFSVTRTWYIRSTVLFCLYLSSFRLRMYVLCCISHSTAPFCVRIKGPTPVRILKAFRWL